MRILMDNGEYGLVNRGDVAMMQVAIARLRDALPSAELGMITADPALLRIYCPGVAAVDAFGGGRWGKLAPGGLQRVAPALVRAERELADRLSRAARIVGRPVKRALLGSRSAARGPGPGSAAATKWPPDALDSADLVLAVGGGYLTDVDEPQAMRTLTLLREAARRGIPTALVGQGLGPLTKPELVAVAREALPAAKLIALREGLAGQALLESLGVPPSRVVVTGDDAIELAYGLRSGALGSAIGVNLRVVPYSGLGEVDVMEVRRAVQATAAAVSARLVPVHVSEFEDEDRRGTKQLTAGYSSVLRDHRRFGPPADAVRRVGRCRVMVTGTYHAAVFALSQGIPAIGLPRSEYYADKFAGLADQFGDGCQVVALDAAHAGAKLGKALWRAWEQAPLLREPLLESARRQVALGRGALVDLPSLIGDGGVGTRPL